MSIKSKIEFLFDKLGRGIFRHPLKILAVMVAIIGSLAAQIPNLTIDTSFEGMLRENNHERILLNEFRDQFSGSELIVLMIESPDIFNVDFLKRLNAFHKDIESNVPYLLEVGSLINARRTYAKGDTLYVEDLLKGFPDQPVNMSEIKRYALSNPFFLDHFVSQDGRYTAIVLETEAAVGEDLPVEEIAAEFYDDESSYAPIPPKKRYFSEKENTMVVKALERIIKKYETSDFSISVTGSPIIVEAYNRCTQNDMAFLIILSSLAMVFFLALLFRRLSGVAFPFIIVQSSLVSTLGLMSLGHVSISIMTMILPSFLIAVGVADAIHVLTIFFKRFDQGADKEDAISYALSHSGVPIFMTSVTTAAGLLSFSFAELTAIGDLGLYAAAGVMLALLYTVVMLPAILSIAPVRQKVQVTDAEVSLMDRVLLSFIRLSTTHPVKVVLAGILIALISVWYIFKINVSHDTLNYFPDDMTVKTDLIAIDKHLKGNLALEVVIDTHMENGVCDPEFLLKLEATLNRIASVSVENIVAGKIFSILDILKETNQALHGNNPAFYTLPQDRDMIIQELLLFENSGSDDLRRLSDSQYSKIRISMKIPWVDLVVTNKYIVAVKRVCEDAFGNNCDITITGLTALMGRTLPIAIESMMKSYIIAIVIISVLMVVLVGTLKTGIISMVPNVLPIIVALGFMGALKIPMDLTALMIGSIAIGLVVDDTMHFMYNFQKYYLLKGDVYKAMEETILGTGRALLITSLVLSSNFFVFTLATLNNLTIFGFITGITILLALLSDFLMAPALLAIVYKTGRKRSFN